MAATGLRTLLEQRVGEDYDTYARGINPQFVRVLRTIGFDRLWARAEGAYLYDTDGKRYLDALGGFGMFNVGRNNPRVRAALAEELLRRAPRSLGKVLFTSSGTEAVEAALKLGRAAVGRTRVLSAENGFHGLTLGSLSASGTRAFSDRFGPLLP